MKNNMNELRARGMKNLEEAIKDISKMECKCSEMNTVCDRCRALSFAIHAKDSLERL